MLNNQLLIYRYDYISGNYNNLQMLETQQNTRKYYTVSIILALD